MLFIVLELTLKLDKDIFLVAWTLEYCTPSKSYYVIFARFFKSYFYNCYFKTELFLNFKIFIKYVNSASAKNCFMLYNYSMKVLIVLWVSSLMLVDIQILWKVLSALSTTI